MVILKYLKAFGGGVGSYRGLQRQSEDLRRVVSYLESDVISVMFHCLRPPKVGRGGGGGWLLNEVEAGQCLGLSVVYGGPCALDGQLDYDNPFQSYQQSPKWSL